jgi:hypothetical protein
MLIVHVSGQCSSCGKVVPIPVRPAVKTVFARCPCGHTATLEIADVPRIRDAQARLERVLWHAKIANTPETLAYCKTPESIQAAGAALVKAHKAHKARKVRKSS